MFTGIIEQLGTVATLERHVGNGSARLTLDLGSELAGDLGIGESLAVNGCCLTVVETDPAAGRATFDLLAETLRATNLGDLTQADPVNLERALLANSRLSGHFVQGHVDCTAEIAAFEAQGSDHRLEVKLPREFATLVAYKGSIAIDGISLTVADVDDAAETFTVWIIPHTLEVTTLKGAAPGGRVNLEFDLLARYLQRQSGESA